MELEFKCQACNSYRFEEVMTGVTVISEINSVDEDGDIDYGEQTNEDGEVSHYQCTGCGRPLPVENVHVADSLPECLMNMKEDRAKDKQKKLLEAIRSAQLHLVNHSVDLGEERKDQTTVEELITELGILEKEIAKYGCKIGA
jgi:hypothetical protein